MKVIMSVMLEWRNKMCAKKKREGKEQKSQLSLTPFLQRASVPLLALPGTTHAVRIHIRESTKVPVLYSLSTSD